MRSLFFVLPLYYSYSFCASSLVRAVGAVVIVTQICLLIYLFCFTYDIAFVPFSDWLWIVCVCICFFFVCSFSYYILFCRHRNRRLPYTILHNKFSEENRRKEKGIERSTISWMIIMIQSLIRQFSHFDSCYISFYRFATKFIIASLCISFSFHFISLVMFGLLLIIFKHASDTNPQQQKPLTIQNKFTLWKISLERDEKQDSEFNAFAHCQRKIWSRYHFTVWKIMKKTNYFFRSSQSVLSRWRDYFRHNARFSLRNPFHMNENWERRTTKRHSSFFSWMWNLIV